MRIFEGSVSSHPTQLSDWSQESSGIENEADGDDLFGYAVAAGDFDGDGYSDLAVGAAGDGAGAADHYQDWLAGNAAAARSAYSADLVGLVVKNISDACGSFPIPTSTFLSEIRAA
ncbi:MAG: FG-GAP repeat protein [Acidobacteriota bacterium]